MGTGDTRRQQPVHCLVCQPQERGTLLSQLPMRSSPAIALRHSTAVKILLPRLFAFFLGRCRLIPGIELPVQHGVELLLQALPDFFFIIVFAPQMIHGEVDEQIIGDLYAFHFPILSYPRRSQRLRRLFWRYQIYRCNRRSRRAVLIRLLRTLHCQLPYR